MNDTLAKKSATKTAGLFGWIADRHVMVFLCALCTCINYADRVNMSVAIIYIAQTYSFSLRQQSWIMSAFFLGYIPMQFGGAILCRRMGGKLVLCYGALLWSIFTLLTPLSAEMGLWMLLLCRVLMGLSEGVAFPGVFHFLSTWIPSDERGRAIAFFLTGAHVGTTLALILSPLIIAALDWRYVFYFFGSLGFLWIASWQLLAYDRDINSCDIDENKKAIVTKMTNTDEIDIGVGLMIDSQAAAGNVGVGSSGDVIGVGSVGANIGSTMNDRGTKSAMKNGTDKGLYETIAKMTGVTKKEVEMVGVILTNRRTLCVCASQGIFAMIHFVILSWLPTYFKNVYKTDTKSLSFTFIPYATMACAANAGGWIADLLIRNGFDITYVRKMITLMSSIGAGIAIIVFSMMQDVYWGLFMAALSMGFMSMNSGGFESAYLDLATPAATGLFKAVANTTGSFAGFLAVPLSTLVLDLAGGSWRILFGSLSICHALLGIVFFGMYSAERVL